ncbi:unnamed protein product [Cuscuta epithymum]|uniref:Pentatricopeptide repeat-containing protein n=3 Tax=Cuscuta epithymum TaxID=186058 RepID=A0AAV0FM82_9ASTE|nr:unnamed protein product [Cuscuta epithymum]
MQSNLVYMTTKLIALARSGQVMHARKLFDEMLLRDVVAWNSMLSSYSRSGLHQEALSLFKNMRIGAVQPDDYTFTSMLSACAGSSELKYGKKIHALLILCGYNACLPVNNALIDMYGKCFSHDDANRVFEEMDATNEVSWSSLLFAYVNVNELDIATIIFKSMLKKGVIAYNTMIAGHSRRGEVGLSFGLFRDMFEEPCTPDKWTLSALMTACSESRQHSLGCTLHSYILKSGWSSASEANNSTLSFYASVGRHKDALKLAQGTDTVLNEVSWNVVIDIHMKLGNICEAFTAFTQAAMKNLVSWTTMIAGCARNGHGEEAINLFIDMSRNGSDIKPDEFTLGAVLHACSTLPVLGHGKMVHGFGFKQGFISHTYVGNGLVNMYGKCGETRDSHAAFCEILEKDLVSWNTMLFSYGLHGCSTQAFQLLEEMVACGVCPDKATFIGLLMSCSHSGLVDNSGALFESMAGVYGISPGVDHVTCLVDILARGGYMEEARRIADVYSERNSTALPREVLFGACSSQHDIELGLELGKSLKILEPQNEMSYVLMSNLYCASGQWKEAEMVRQAMVDEGIKKIPGFSRIEVQRELITVVAGIDSNPWMGELNGVLSILHTDMRCL